MFVQSCLFRYVDCLQWIESCPYYLKKAALGWVRLWQKYWPFSGFHFILLWIDIYRNCWDRKDVISSTKLTVSLI